MKFALKQCDEFSVHLQYIYIYIIYIMTTWSTGMDFRVS